MKSENGLGSILKSMMIDTVPAYANKLYYSLGFLSATSFVILLLSGITLIARGPVWWLTTSFGIYVRSVHLWATQAFVLFMVIHLLIVFFTYAYRKPRQITWVLGGIMLFVALFEAEFGYLLRGDFSSQWRGLQASDLYNGSGLGAYINNLNFTQIYGIHTVILPFLIIAILLLHYTLVRKLGIATPHRTDIHHTVVKANHTVLFMRGVVAVIVILLLAAAFKSPIIDPVTVQSVANSDSGLMAQTLLVEMDGSSDTATYMDHIDPYTYNLRDVYIFNPYQQATVLDQSGSTNWASVFQSEPTTTQDEQVKAAEDYFTNGGAITTSEVQLNPVIPLISKLVVMGQSGLYEDSLREQASQGYNPTYATRFLADTGVLEAQATSLGITTDQYGMMREETGHLPGAWWLLPVGLLDHTVLANDANQDQHGAEILGLLILLFLAFPYIPILNRIPDKLSIYKLIWKEKK